MSSSTRLDRRPPDPAMPPAPWRPSFWPAAAVGVVAVGLALALGELLAAAGIWLSWLNAPAAPLNSLGLGFIDLTPTWLKEFATSTFGLWDKFALRVGMGVTLLIVAGAVGVLARRNRWWAVAVTGLLVVVTLVAVYTRAGVGGLDWLPIVVAGAVGAWLLVVVFRPIQRWDAPDEAIGPVVEAAGSTPMGKISLTGDRHPMVAALHRLGLDRRAFFRLTGVAAASAVVAAVLTRLVPSTAAVQASRDRVAAELGLRADSTSTTGATTAAQGAVATGTAAPIKGASGTTASVDSQIIPAGTDLQVNGLSPFVVSNADFYRIDTALTPPRVTAEDWKLKVHGMVGQEMTVTYDQLVKRPQVERAVTLTCVSNDVGGGLCGNARWQGAHLGDLIKEAGPTSGADCVLATSVDGFTSTSPLEALIDGRDALLAVAMNGEPLPVEHGFPVRMVVPGLYGYVSATKWVVDLKVSTFAAESAYWTQRGWADHGPVKTSSRFDVPKDESSFPIGHKVVFAGMAWAQHRGISSVEIKIDDGPWLTTEMSQALSNDTWRQWRYQWIATAGKHSVVCRATDGTGAVQDATVRDVLPDGATGYHQIRLSVS